MTPSLLRSLSRTLLLAFVSVLVLWVAGCDKDGSPKPLPNNDLGNDPPSTESCADRDGDGFGAGCSGGLDCDDGDSTVTNECYRCQTPNEGCPCDEDGKTVECGHVSSQVGDKVTCVTGDRVCTDGKWGACSVQSMQTQTLSKAELDMLASARLDPLVVATNPVACLTANLCDPFCKRYDTSTKPDVDTNTSVDATGVNLVQTGVVGGGPATGSSCGTQMSNATRAPIGIMTMVQRSRNMTSTTLASVKSALTKFYTASTSAGIVAGLDVFPCVGCSSSPPITSPVANACKVGTDNSMCCGFQYDGPAPNAGYLNVPMAALPGTSNAQQTALTTGPNGVSTISAVASGFGADSPMLPALQGAIDAAAQWSAGVPNSKPIVLLVTDGIPDECGNCGGKKGKSAKNKSACRVQEVVNAAEQAYFRSTPITTLVIGIQSGRADANLKYLDSIARAGSGGKYGAFIVSAATDTQILAAINQIRDDAVSCSFPVPPPSGSNIIDPSTATVTLSGTNIPRVAGIGACGSSNGFFYDSTLPSLELCPTTCTTAKANLTANIQITYGCKTGCSSGSSRAAPGPLDLLFMVDRSDAMANELKDSSGTDVGVTAWQAMQTTLRNFARSPDAVGLGMAVSYFPPPLTSGQKCLTCNYCQDSLGTDTCDSCNGIGILGICLGTPVTDTYLKGPVPWPYCPEPRNGGTAGDCINNTTGGPAYGYSDLSYEYLSGDSASCTFADYTNYAATGGVDFNVLPNGSPATNPPHWQNIFNSIGRVIPKAMSGSLVARVTPAITGALNTAKARITATGRKTAVVLLTSGIPATASAGNCSTSPSTVTTAVQNGYTNGVQTYVIGIGAGATSAQLDPIARAGVNNSSATAYIINNAADPSAFIAAMNSIRRQAATCDFAIPTPPAGGVLDYTQTSVHLTAGSPATDTTLAKISTSATCAATKSWYYDNNTTPSLLSLCSTPCTTVKSDVTSRIDVTYQCVPPAPTYSVGVATFEFDATNVCGQDEVPVWADFSWQTTTPSDSKVTFAVATGTRTGTTVSNLSSEVQLKYSRVAMFNQNACAASYVSGPANSCGYTIDTKNAGPQYASIPNDVYVDKTLAQFGLPRDQNYLRIRATLTPSTDLLSRPAITGWDLQVSCKTVR